jgi:hypothetical protein
MNDPDTKVAVVARAEGWSPEQGKHAMASLKKAFAERFGDPGTMSMAETPHQ